MKKTGIVSSGPSVTKKIVVDTCQGTAPWRHVWLSVADIVPAVFLRVTFCLRRGHMAPSPRLRTPGEPHPRPDPGSERGFSLYESEWKASQLYEGNGKYGKATGKSDEIPLCIQYEQAL